ncbi:glycosyltransferase family 4 protein [Paenibacillus whitsoniae]|uniref:Glycosyltransferase n=1 Tax=Paenibacillus whitsoniae TaxID=2496558 RepID=A0A3S0C7P4_9BACL|nr:glycosyltransferase family 1 protein [Paenibacillus whitsoniae]RTE07923.1 glycosyltransferase [Paenibacillus whitsoniae]
MKANYKIALRIIGGEKWLGGVSYIELLARAVSTLPPMERPELFLVAADSSLDDFYLHEHFLHCFDGIIYVGKDTTRASDQIKHPWIHCSSYDELSEKIDFYYPVLMDVLPHRCAASWIPDFQYRYLPEITSQEERLKLDLKYQEIADRAKLIVFSSNDAREDFHGFYPDSKAVTKILSFHVEPDARWYDVNPRDIQNKFGLPDKYIICCNQFWAHKNFEVLFRSIRILKDNGHVIHVVCTGSTEDYRVRDYFTMIKQLISELDISDQVHILGIISREEQIQLIRRSCLVVQPSLFEGWSTIVEECRALGKTVVLSDLKVNLEQNPQHAIYFDRTDAEDLAQKLKHAYLAAAGPDLEREKVARDNSVHLMRTFALQFSDIWQTAKQIF